MEVLGCRPILPKILDPQTLLCIVIQVHQYVFIRLAWVDFMCSDTDHPKEPLRECEGYYRRMKSTTKHFSVCKKATLPGG